jgi:hypothetical protein
MISDEPDEDADDLDDENLLIAYMGGTSSRLRLDTEAVVSDWPPQATQDLGLSVDAETLRWFKNNYADWRQGMRSVLRAWVDIRTGMAAGAVTKPEPLQ